MSRINRYTQETWQALLHAREEAVQLRHRLIAPEHILLGILRLKDPLIESLFSSLQISTARLRQAVDFVVGRGGWWGLVTSRGGVAQDAVVSNR